MFPASAGQCSLLCILRYPLMFLSLSIAQLKPRVKQAYAEPLRVLKLNKNKLEKTQHTGDSLSSEHSMSLAGK